MTAQKDLANLLLSLFSADELRRWLRYLPEGDGLTAALPGPNASPADLAEKAVIQLAREAMIDEEFWKRLLEERPRRKADIDAVKGLYAAGGVAASGGSARGGAAVAASTPATVKVTVLLVSASPKEQVRLRVDREFRDVIDRMKKSRHRDEFIFVQIQAARFDDLRTALQEHRPQVLHISAHGEEDGSLILEGKLAEPYRLSSNQFTRLLRALPGLRLVVLNACHSHEVARVLPAVSGLAVGMSDLVADEQAIDFAVGFYESLGFGNSVESAFDVALAGLPDDDPNPPLLFPPADRDPENRRKAPLIKV